MSCLRLSGWAVLMVLVLHVSPAQTTVYVSPTGSDTNAGTIDQPFKSVSKGLTAVGASGVVILRGGVYLLGTSKLSLSKIAQAGSLIKLWAYPGETPILDCTGNTSDGISVSGSYYHLKGLEVRNAGHNGINISGNYNIIENCAIHDNKNTGLHLTGSAAPGPSNNLILNCDAYRNYDPPIGGNADGFSAKWTVGPGNVFRGCRAYLNSDDGWDLWMATGSVLIDSCFAFRNGVDVWYSGSFDGNGNGFKLGGNFISTPHTVKNCVSFDNAANTGRGFDENNNTAGQTLYNCTAFRNKGDNFHFKNIVDSGQTHIIKNCISLEGVVGISSGTQVANSWQGFTVSAADFKSIDTAFVTAPRNADGRLPASSFLRLAASSRMIDAGIDVGLPYTGSAPDLGAFEAGPLTRVGDEAMARPEFRLAQNYPNPFSAGGGSAYGGNRTTVISYQLSAVSVVRLRVYDALGREVAELVNDVLQPGAYTVRWDASSFSSGVYYCRLQAGAASSTSRMILTK
ncbi:MAG: right-handed parallel beta-helix repeat-containing protein [Ignavibacteriales bacterium]|nr:right-handed parallel beta-helix repeat-containing protein [Ignavibacteriales bacterium]